MNTLNNMLESLFNQMKPGNLEKTEIYNITEDTQKHLWKSTRTVMLHYFNINTDEPTDYGYDYGYDYEINCEERDIF